MSAWPGETASLEGLIFGQLTVEAPGRVDARGVRVLCRCACGRVAVRLVAELRASTACRTCTAQAEERDRRDRAIARAEASSHPQATRVREWRHRTQRRDPIIRACRECGSVWCVVPGTTTKPTSYCGDACRRRSANHRAYTPTGGYRCGFCGELGHNVRTCSEAP